MDTPIESIDAARLEALRKAERLLEAIIEGEPVEAYWTARVYDAVVRALIEPEMIK